MPFSPSRGARLGPASVVLLLVLLASGCGGSPAKVASRIAIPLLPKSQVLDVAKLPKS